MAKGAAAAYRGRGSGKRVHLISFDASEPVIAGLRQGSIEGVVLQNPLKMGELGVKTLVQHLEKQPVERRIPTGETLVTPENMNTPDIKPMVFAPKADNVSGSLSGAKSRKWPVMSIPKEFPRITLLTESEYAGTASDQAQQQSQSQLTRYRGQFDGVFCPNETSTVGMMRALEEAGLLAGRH